MTMKSETKDKVALVGTPCHMTAAAKIDTFSDYLGESPLDIKIGLFCMEIFLLLHETTLSRKWL